MAHLDTVDPQAAQPVLSRRQKQPRKRPTYYYEPKTGLLTHADGHTRQLIRENGLRGVLAHLEANSADEKRHVVYLVCGPLAGDAPYGNDTHRSQQWYREPAADGWTVALRWENPPHRVAKYSKGSMSVDLRHTSAWWDACTDVTAIRRAAAALERRLRREWQSDHVLLLGTPAQTGLDLMERALPYGRAFPTLPEEIREEMDATWRIQHRRDLCPAPALLTLPGFCLVDARLAYGACLWRVPTEFEGLDDVPDLEDHGWQPGWYDVVARVPSDWAGFGLLPVREGPGEAIWPGSAGAKLEGWVHGRHVANARACGWDVRIRRRLRFASKHDPLEGWARRLRGMYSDALRMEQTHEDADMRAGYALIKVATRHIMLDTIGSLARRETRETVLYPPGVSFPVDPEHPPVRTAYGVLVSVARPLSQEQQRYQHPEWAAHIWAVAQVKITNVALQLPREHVVGFRADEVFLTHDPGFEATGRIGEMRRKGRLLPGPLAVPESWEELSSLVEQAQEGV